MCGRFVMTHPSDALARIFDAQPDNDLPEGPNYNVCPTVQVHAVTNADGTRRLQSLRWGFVPFWAKALNDGPLLINARAETIVEKPTFRDAAKKRRCVIPASGFYEWTKDAQGNRLPWFIHPPDDAPLAFAGIWQVWDKGEAPVTTCAIVTCAANDAMGRIHHRMPVILDRKDVARWLGETDEPAAPLMRPAPEGALEMYRVDSAVNSNRAGGPRLIAPLDAA